ncbi:MAG: hypothetical protein KJZ90_02165 [Rhodocyclaceae bacterium]|nr:hypothetical protein [Rhodocyclaceae bacterium]
MATTEQIESCKASLERVQNFEASSLARVEDLGRELNFAIVVSDTERLIALYRRLPVSILSDLPGGNLDQIKRWADAEYNRFEQIMKFSAATQNAGDTRNTLITQMQSAYDTAFSNLWQYIAFGVARATDTTVLETEARATLQDIRDKADTISAELAEHQQGADAILANIKRVAAEAGVSQQAEHFKQEADRHETAAATWETTMLNRAKWVGGFAILSIFLHKIPWIGPTTNIESAQLISSKILIFIVLGYLLVLAAKNFLSHKHNAVVNRHRQNALLTYRALADAAHERGAEDIVLAHAASCIFAPQDTGYSKGGESSSSSRSILELLTRTSAKESAS